MSAHTPPILNFRFRVRFRIMFSVGVRFRVMVKDRVRDGMVLEHSKHIGGVRTDIFPRMITVLDIMFADRFYTLHGIFCRLL